MFARITQTVIRVDLARLAFPSFIALAQVCVAVAFPIAAAHLFPRAFGVLAVHTKSALLAIASVRNGVARPPVLTSTRLASCPSQTPGTVALKVVA